MKKRIIAFMLVLVSLCTVIFESSDVIGGWGLIDQHRIIGKIEPIRATRKDINKTKEIHGTLYSDVPESYWSYKWISAATDVGILFGYGDNKFGPRDYMQYGHFVSAVKRVNYFQSYGYENLSGYISRNEAVYWIWKAAGCPYADVSYLAPYTDFNTDYFSSSYVNAWAWCIKTGLISGTSNTTLSPYNCLVREHSAVLLVKYYCYINRYKIEWFI